MKTEEFREKWEKAGSLSGMRVVKIQDASILCNKMYVYRIGEIDTDNNERYNEDYDEAVLQRVIGDVVFDIATVKISGIRDVV